MGAGWLCCPPLDRALGLAALGSMWELTCVGESIHGDVLPQTFFTTFVCPGTSPVITFSSGMV